MRRISCALFALLPLFAASLAQAAVHSRDWKTPGDGLLTYDDANQREWLDFSVSLLEQFPGSTAEQRYQTALLELAPGGRFEGFTVGRREDALALAQSAGIETATLDFAINQTSTLTLIDLLEPAVIQSTTLIVSLGLIDELVTGPGFPRRSAAILEVFQDSRPAFSRAGLKFSHGDDSIRNFTTGIVLYRSVPEPTSVNLMFGPVCALAYLLRRRPISAKADLP